MEGGKINWRASVTRWVIPDLGLSDARAGGGMATSASPAIDGGEYVGTERALP
jgi:hypothetical protein